MWRTKERLLWSFTVEPFQQEDKPPLGIFFKMCIFLSKKKIIIITEIESLKHSAKCKKKKLLGWNFFRNRCERFSTEFISIDWIQSAALPASSSPLSPFPTCSNGANEMFSSCLSPHSHTRRLSSSAWWCPAAGGRSPWSRARWRPTTPTWATTNTCTEAKPSLFVALPAEAWRGL